MDDLTLLKLIAKDAEDVKILSACLQDSLISLREIYYDAPQKQFVLLVNRYKWEEKEASSKGARIHAALSFDHVVKVQFRGFDPQSSQQTRLSLLSVSYEPPYIYMTFAQNGSIRLEVEQLKVKLRDADLAWPAKTPLHP